MILVAIVLAGIGLFLSAFFSGTETGFYRATRIRLVLDALDGDRVSRMLLWVTNRPSLFIATTLVGNNLANYVTSLALVLLTGTIVSGEGHLAELIAPVIAAPLLFVYGELMPKNLYLHAPNRLLRGGAVLFLVCVPLFSIASGLLWALDRLLARLVRHQPEEVRLLIAGRELRRILEEGHQVGILHDSQRALARGIFSAGRQAVGTLCLPQEDFPVAGVDQDKQALRDLAREQQAPAVLLEDDQSPTNLVGYVRMIDLSLETSSDPVATIRSLLKIPADEPVIDALMHMHTAGETLATAINEDGTVQGILTTAHLRQTLFGAEQ